MLAKKDSSEGAPTKPSYRIVLIFAVLKIALLIQNLVEPVLTCLLIGEVDMPILSLTEDQVKSVFADYRFVSWLLFKIL